MFKVPAVPGIVGGPKTSSPKLQNDNQNSFAETFFTGATATDKNIFNKSIRRSMRISQRFTIEKQADVNNSNLFNETENNTTLRRSARRSILPKSKLICNQRRNSQKPSDKTNNTIMENCYNSTSLSKHRKAILDLLNKGSRKELQILPTIGQKRAFQIVTHRYV